MNTFKTYLLTQLGAHLWTMEDKDRSNIWNSSALTVKSLFINDFFDFYLKELKLTPEELMKASDSSRLINILYNSSFQQLEQRKTWRELFESTIVNNSIFFKDALKNCLNSHANVLTNNYPEDFKNYHIEENKKLFEQLIKKGKESGIFNSINQEELSTSYFLYKNILEKEGIFKSEFSFTKLMDSLSSNKNKRNEENKFFQTYFVDIIYLLTEKPEKITEISNNDINLNNFVAEILTINDPTNYKLQLNFISELIKTNSKVREVINKEYKKLFYNNFSSLVPQYFNSLNHAQEQYIFNDNNYGLNNSRLKDNYGNKAVNWLALFISDEKNKPANFDSFDLILKKQKKIGEYIEIEELNEYCSRIKVAFIAKHIEHNELQIKKGLPNQENEIIEYLHKSINSTDFIINPKNNNTGDDIVNLEKVYNFIKEKDGSSLSFIKDKIDFNIHKLIKEIFSGNNHYNKDKYVDFLVQSIESFECSNSLTIINEKEYAWDLEIDKKITNSNKKTTYVSQPFAFIIINESPKIFKWFLNSPQLEVLAKIKYKTKNIVEYLSTKSNFNEYLNILSENPEGFKKLVLENKKTFKKLANSENENIKNTTNFLKMEDKLPPKEIKSKALKI